MNTSRLSRCLLLPLLLQAAVLCAEDSRPNMVFLMTDDQASYSLGCYGNRDVATPNLDRLAADGIAFDHHYTTTAICMASRANVMTGLYEFRHGCNFGHGPLQEAHWHKSYPLLLRRAGYVTGFAGKFGFLVQGASGGRAKLPVDDFDMWGGGPGQTSYQTKNNESMARYAAEFPHSSRAYGAFGRDFIKAAAKTGRPFCLSVSFKAPHKPDQPDPKFDDVYAGQRFAKPANFGREHGEHFSQQSRQGRQYKRFVSWGYRDRYDEAMALYHQLVHGVDSAVGMIRQALAAAGVAENTVIIFTSDNGFFCGSHGCGSKVLPYEEASKAPLIMYDPRHPNSGKKLRSSALTGNIDFAPTMLELAGVKLPRDIDGKSLLPLYDNPRASIHESLTLINVWGPQAAHSLSVVTRDYKYIYWPYTGGGMQAAEELYHLAKDPLELKNLAANRQQDAALTRLRAVYDQAVAAWKAAAVPYHGYRQYGAVFDREIPWTPRQPGRRR